MHKSSTIIFFCLFLLLSLNIFGQNKYAVLVGINDYYSSPTEKSPQSLKGCVNDALSMKSLLRNRFGFDQKNINILLNEKASQTPLMNTLLEVLAKSKAGDAVFFYFSGHGIYVDNVALINDPVKKGYNQSLVMSDLYAADFNCLVKDNTLKKIFNQFVAKKVILTAIFDCCYSGKMSMTLNSELLQQNPYIDDAVSDTSTLKSLDINDLNNIDRAVNLNVMPVIVDKEVIPRPSETKNSNFAAISACMDDEKASEIWDESGVPHGALTKAILSSYEKSATDIPLTKLLENISSEIGNYQKFKQKPTYHYDENRNVTNLIGLPLQAAAKPIAANCIRVKNNSITLDGGYCDGFANGNILANSNTKIIIIRIYRDSAIATFAPAAKIKIGDTFLLSDAYKTSNPILKVYIETVNVTTPVFLNHFNKEILPLSKKKTYVDYFNWLNDLKSPTFLSFGIDGEGNKISSYITNQRFAVLLKVPKDIALSIKQSFKNDQSIQFVNAIQEADRVLYLNYAAKSPFNPSPCFVLTYRNALNGAFDAADLYKFSKLFVRLNQLTLNPAAMTVVKKSIRSITYDLARSRGSNWFNSYPKR
ncbi:MAG: caspase family protein [Pedobacter sp.]|nr:MAG: caspase family protein [Pedobacter sp.]